MAAPRGAERVALRRVDPLPLRDELRALHGAALGPGALSAQWAQTRLPVHVARSGFVFLVAETPEGLAGFGYGYSGSPGDWWSERVAAALTGAQRAAWVAAPHFEVVELHVHPQRQRAGLGTTLLDELLASQPHDRALLTTRGHSDQARRFYAKNGWQELGPVHFGAGFPPYVALGRRL